MTNPIPTIKGIFVKSHVAAVLKAKGKEGVLLLERQYGKPLTVDNFEDVAVSEEVRLIELALQIMSDTPVPPEALAFEAGKLHFRNFATTPFGRIALAHPKTYLKTVLMNAPYIAEHVFQGITFHSYDEGPQKIRIVMKGGEYPTDHFKGLFFEWIRSFGYTPTINAKKTTDETYEYEILWTN